MRLHLAVQVQSNAAELLFKMNFSDGSDFTRTVGLNILQDASRTFCLIVPITDDDLPEDVESFTVILRPEAQQSGVIVRPNVTEIFIQDNDGMLAIVQ